MRQFTIDFTGVKTVWYFYEAIIQGLSLPGWCGKNPDAIWDMLTGYVEYPATIYLKGVNKLPKELESEKTIMIKVFQRVLDNFDDKRFTIKIIS